MSPEQHCWIPGSRKAPGVARHRVTTILGPTHPLLFDAHLIASELVTNACLHTRSGLPGGQVGLIIAPLVCGCLIEVADAGPRTGAPKVPRRRTPGGDETEGRGLLLIEATARAWGTTDHVHGGRSVWALLVHECEGVTADAA